jgi:hypothetical protein
LGARPSRQGVVALSILALVAQRLRSAFTQIVMWLAKMPRSPEPQWDENHCRSPRPALLAATLEALRLGQRRERLERVVLDLANPLAGDTEGASDLLERLWLTAIEAEAQLDDASLAVGQRGQRLLDLRA